MSGSDRTSPGLEPPLRPSPESASDLLDSFSVDQESTTPSPDTFHQSNFDAAENMDDHWLAVNDAVMSDGEDDLESEQIVLDPDHPLMIRFQEALGNHLRKRLEELDIADRDLNIKVAATKKERERLGIALYGDQQELALCQSKLESVNQSLQGHTAQRLCRELEMNNIRKLYKNIANEMDQSKRQASEMQKDLDNVNLRLYSLINGHEDVRNDAKVMRRTALKTRQDLGVLEEEKEKQDFRVDMLIELIDQKNTEIEMLKAQTIAQETETFRYKDYLSEANMELEVLQADLKQVDSNWKSMLIGMKKRDEALAALSESVRNEEKMLLCKEKEIEAYKKSVLQYEEKHERLTYMMNKLTNDIANSKKKLAKSQHKFDELKMAFSQQNRMLQTLDKSLGVANAIKSEKSAELLSLRSQYEKAVQSRNELKECLLGSLQSQSEHSKAAEYAKKKTLATMHLIAKLENSMSADENSLAILEQDIIAVEARISQTKGQVAALGELLKEKHQTVTNYETSFNRNHIIIERKQNYMDDCNREVSILLRKREGNEVSPLENLVLNLTRSLRKESKVLLDDQTMWLESQYKLLTLGQEKRDCESEKKHKHQIVLVLNGKKRKLDAKQSADVKFYEVDMTHLRIEMEKLATLVTEKKGKKDEMAASGYLLETEFIRELREIEINIFKMQDRLVDINSEKESLLNQLVHIEKQTSWWERKIQLGIEIKAAVDPKNNQNFDLHSMKSEIHRMTVRYQSLMREQERLIRAMEDSVTRRDYVVFGYKYSASRDSNVLTNTKWRRQIHEAKSKISKCKKEMMEMTEEGKQLRNETISRGKKLNELKVELARIRDNTMDVESTLERSSSEKYKNLSELVARQRKSAMYSDLKQGRYKMLHSNSAQRDIELRKEKDKMERLINIVTQLKEEHPKASQALERSLGSYGLTPTTSD